MAEVKTTPDKVQYLQALANLNAESLKILAELAQKPGVEQKLKANQTLIKTLI